MKIVMNTIKVSLSRSDSTQFCLGWSNEDTTRCHVWMSRERTIDSSEPILFKNPPVGVKYKDMDNGWFPTRHLDLNAKTNREAFEKAFAYATDNKLFEGAEEKVKADEAAEAEVNRLAYLERCKKEAGPQLYAALKNLLASATIDTPNMIHRTVPSWNAIVDAQAALDAAQPKEKK